MKAFCLASGNALLARLNLAHFRTTKDGTTLVSPGVRPWFQNQILNGWISILQRAGAGFQRILDLLETTNTLTWPLFHNDKRKIDRNAICFSFWPKCQFLWTVVKAKNEIIWAVVAFVFETWGRTQKIRTDTCQNFSRKQPQNSLDRAIEIWRGMNCLFHLQGPWNYTEAEKYFRTHLVSYLCRHHLTGTRTAAGFAEVKRKDTFCQGYGADDYCTSCCPEEMSLLSVSDKVGPLGAAVLTRWASIHRLQYTRTDSKLHSAIFCSSSACLESDKVLLISQWPGFDSDKKKLLYRAFNRFPCTPPVGAVNSVKHTDHKTRWDLPLHAHLPAHPSLHSCKRRAQRCS